MVAAAERTTSFVSPFNTTTDSKSSSFDNGSSALAAASFTASGAVPERIASRIRLGVSVTVSIVCGCHVRAMRVVRSPEYYMLYARSIVSYSPLDLFCCANTCSPNGESAIMHADYSANPLRLLRKLGWRKKLRMNQAPLSGPTSR